MKNNVVLDLDWPQIWSGHLWFTKTLCAKNSSKSSGKNVLHENIFLKISIWCLQWNKVQLEPDSTCSQSTAWLTSLLCFLHSWITLKPTVNYICNTLLESNQEKWPNPFSLGPQFLPFRQRPSSEGWGLYSLTFLSLS